MKIVAFDTETTGFPDWKSPSDGEGQPHMVQLAAMLADEDRNIIDQMDVIIRPDNWIIPAETIEIHGISNEQAMDEGIPEAEALERYLSIWQQSDLRIAHNSTFDNRILWIAIKRYMPERITKELWKQKDLYYCTLQNAKRIMGGRDGHKLAECLLHFTGRVLEDAHSAMPDTQACLDIYWAIQDLESGDG